MIKNAIINNNKIKLKIIFTLIANYLNYYLEVKLVQSMMSADFNLISIIEH